MNFSSLYRSKVVTAAEAVAQIKSGSRVYLGGGSGVPIELMHAMTARAPELRNVEVVHILTFADAPYMAPELQASFRHNALFIGHNARKAVQEGRADFTPVFLSEIPDLFRPGGTLPLDAAMVSLSWTRRWYRCRRRMSTASAASAWRWAPQNRQPKKQA